jgi:nucleoside phosphorylase
MNYIVTALAGEAIPIINTFKLKKEVSYSRYDVFRNDNIKLILSGVGKVKSSIATTYLLTKENPNPEDRIINFGICGSSIKEYQTGKMFLINKINDQATGKNFYPETEFRHTFSEEKIMTFDKPVKIREWDNFPNCLVDMEASGFYEASSMFFHSHRIHLLKIVSDHLKGEKLTGSFVQGLVEKNMNLIKQLLLVSNRSVSKDASVLGEKDYEVFESVSNDLKLSTTQRFQVLDLIKGYKVRSGGDIDFLKSISKEKKNSKTENKKIFESIVEKLEDVGRD